MSPPASLNSCSGEPAARGPRRGGEQGEREGQVSIPVLVNLRLGVAAKGVHIAPPAEGLNSCSGEPAARGGVRRYSDIAAE